MAVAGMGGEFDFIRRLRSDASRRGTAPDLLRGIGDDAAVIRQFANRDTLVTADLLVEDVDFQRNTTPPTLLGHKALAVSLSDIAAMGGRPRWALVSLGVPDEVWQSDFVEKFYDGLFALADRFNVKVIGGDVSRTPEKIVVDSIVLGECAHGRAVMRRGAQLGDQLFVTGSLGGSAAGLRLLARGVRLETKDLDDPDSDSVRQLAQRHLCPGPRVGWGLVLGEEGLATAMIDISDGLSSDLNHLCEESVVGALIEAARLPIDPLLVGLCGRRALDPLLLALHGGEDFELLFTVAAENLAKLPSKVDGVGITCIGEIREQSSGICIAEGSRVWNLEPAGWEHFKVAAPS